MPETGNTFQVHHTKDWKYLSATHKRDWKQYSGFGMPMTENTIKHTMPETGNAMQIYYAREWKYQATKRCQRLEIPSRYIMQKSTLRRKQDFFVFIICSLLRGNVVLESSYIISDKKIIKTLGCMTVNKYIFIKSRATSHFVCLLLASLWPLQNFLPAWPTFIPICHPLSPPRSRHHSSTFQGMNIKAIWLLSLSAWFPYQNIGLCHWDTSFYNSFHVHPLLGAFNLCRFPRVFLFSSGL